MPQHAETVPAEPRRESKSGAAARETAKRVVQRRAGEPGAAPAPGSAGRSGLPGWLKGGVERLSGLAMDDVRVHRNSAEPAKLGALAFTRGNDIHLGPGQERHLPHEAWHVVQQKEGRVAATAQMKGTALNADAALEAEADRMGAASSAGGTGRAGLERRTASGATCQARLKPSNGTWFDEKDKSQTYSAIALTFMRKKRPFLLRDKVSPSDKVIHVIDMSKKYLLGEKHQSGKWEIDVADWSVDQMKEEGSAIPSEMGDKAGLFVEEINLANQPLESSHAWMLDQLMDAHDYLNVQSWTLRTFDHTDMKKHSTWAEGAWAALDQVTIVYRNNYEPFIDVYEKEYLPSLHDAKTGRDRAPDKRLERIYRFATDLRGYGPKLGNLNKSLNRIRDAASGAAAAPTADEFKTIAAEVNANRQFVPTLAKALIAIVSAGRRKETRRLQAFTTSSDDYRAPKFSPLMYRVRERAMIDNVRKAAAPLLVQIGNEHVFRVADGVGRSAVAVDKKTPFSKITEKP